MSRTAVDKEETGVEVEIIKLENDEKNKTINLNKNGQAHFVDEDITANDMDAIELINYEGARKRPGLLESDI